MSVRNNIIANYVGQGWSAAMNLVFVPVYVSALGIESYALVGIFAALQAWLALLDLGMTPTLQREMARFSGGLVSPTRIRDLLRSVEMICAAIGMLAALALLLGADFIATRWLRTNLPPTEVRTALQCMGVVIGLRFWEAIYRSALYGLERQVWFNGFNVIATTARFGGAALVVLLWRPSIVAFFSWHLLVSAISVILLRAKLGVAIPSDGRAARFSPSALAEIKAFALGMIGINLTALILTQADKVILTRILPMTEFGFYTLAFTMCSVLVAVTAPIVQGAYPRLVRSVAAGDRAAFEATYHRGAQLVAIVASSGAAVLCVFSGLVVRVWTNDPAIAAKTGSLLAALAGGTFLNALMQIPYFGMLAEGETRFTLRMNIVAAVILIIVLLIAVPRYGALAAAETWLAINSGFVTVGLALLHRRHLKGLLHKWYVRDTLPAVTAAFMICVVLRLIAPGADMDRIGGFALLTLAGALALAAATISTRDAFDRLRTFAGRGRERLFSAMVGE
ncbi:oligosaccharide flippase family protein [uncultured Sphingomonas sp.]|uniref:lipopolysaccharide biosynthesis protein n=1 Tax=uncultured Sphingomonas sp. TaxID=158754 RepID=UPI00262A3377|nr:oligosaccharide flippase family protein [uncultured Sphingomonas sp.]